MVAASAHSVTISWPSSIEHIPPPSADDNNPIDDVCSLCQDDLSVLQYASAAYSPTSANSTVQNGAMQAVGPPDAPHCEASPLAWIAYDFSTLEDPLPLEYLYIDLYFAKPLLTSRYI